MVGGFIVSESSGMNFIVNHCNKSLMKTYFMKFSNTIVCSFSFDKGCWPFQAVMYGELIPERDCSGIDWLVVRVVGLRSSYPQVGISVHCSSPTTSAFN